MITESRIARLAHGSQKGLYALLFGLRLLDLSGACSYLSGLSGFSLFGLRCNAFLVLFFCI
jgi:hypothetical protein